MDDKSRVDYLIDEGFPVEKVQKPSFNINEEVFVVDKTGLISKKIIEHITWSIKFVNNGYVNFSTTEYSYHFDIDFWYGSVTDESKMFKTIEEAQVLSNKILEEQKQINNEWKKQRIKELSEELLKLTRDE